MDFLINGSYAPYVYVLLFQVSVFFLQQPGVRELVTSPSGRLIANWYSSYCLLVRTLGTYLNWCGWMLAFYVGYRFGTPSGVLFFCVSFTSSFAFAVIKLSPTKSTAAAHLTSIPVTIYLIFATLRSVGLELAEELAGPQLVND